MLITRTFSLTNFAIATSALGFQVFVLYPWHKQLDEDFEDLKRTILAERESNRRIQVELLAEMRAVRKASEESQRWK